MKTILVLVACYKTFLYPLMFRLCVRGHYYWVKSRLFYFFVYFCFYFVALFIISDSFQMELMLMKNIRWAGRHSMLQQSMETQGTKLIFVLLKAPLLIATAMLKITFQYI